MLYGFGQPGCDIARAFFEVLNHTPTVGSASHECGCHGRNADLDESDSGVRIILFRSRPHDDDSLAGFDNRKRFPDRCYDRASPDRLPRRGVVGKMDGCPSPQMMIVGQCRQDFERELLGIDPVLSRQPVIGRHHQLLLLFKQHGALHQAVVGERKSANRRIDPARSDRLKLVQQRKLYPLDIDMEFAPEMPDEWQGQDRKSTRLNSSHSS